MRGRVLGVAMVSVALAATSLGGPVAAAPDPTAAVDVGTLAGGFDDVPDEHVFDNEIAWLATTGITQGRGDGTFGVDASVTRGQMAAFLYRYDGEPAGPFDAPDFDDVPSGHVFADAIAWLASTGITQGRQDGTFGSDDAVTRGQMAAFLYRHADEPDGPFDALGFDDVPTGHTFVDEIAWLASTGITEGRGDGTFGVDAPVTRGQMAAFLFRFQGWESRDSGPVSVHFVDWDNRTYDALCDEGPGTVRDGAWRDDDHYHRDGDVRFDGRLAWEVGSIDGHDAEVALVTFPCVIGSSTSFYYSQVFSVADGEVVAIGERLHGSGPTLEQGGVRMTNYTWREDDPRCCPSEQEEVLARLIDGQWVEAPL